MKNNSKETIRIKETSKFLIKVANTVFVLGIVLSILVFTYAVYRIYYPLPNITLYFYYFCLVFALITASFFGLGMKRLDQELKVNISLLFITIFISMYIFEIMLEYIKKNPEEIFEQIGVPFDSRSKLEVLEQLRKDGFDAYPNVSPFTFISKDFSQKGLFPFATVSNTKTILSNESGYFPVIETDEHGFNNPKGLYKKNSLDIILIGDSFTEGYSVNADETMGAVLRKAGFNVLSLGKSHNGPLIELGTLKEYVEYLQPAIVLWMYYQNDFYELNSELNSPLLRNYLVNDSFSQNLVVRQDEIDKFLIDHIRVEWKKEKKKFFSKQTIEIIKLTNIRSLINLIPAVEHKLVPSYKEFSQILFVAKEMISSWNGKLYFVELPGFRKKLPSVNEYSFPSKFNALGIAEKLNIDLINIQTEVFEHHPNPQSLFSKLPVIYKYKNWELIELYSGHYNAEGYRLVGEAINDRLKADGIIPLSFKN